MEALGSWRIYLCRDTSASAADVSKSPASSVCYARSGRYVARTQAVGLGPAKPGSDAAEVEPLGGRVTRAAAILPSRACSEAGIGRGGNSPTQRSEWCASEFQRRTPLSIHVEVVHGRRGRTVSVLGGFVSDTCASYCEFSARARRVWWVGREARRVRASEHEDDDG